MGVAGELSQWEVVGVVSLAQGSLSSHCTAPIAPTSAPCFCLGRQPYVTTGKPSATFYLAQAPSPALSYLRPHFLAVALHN